MYHRRDGCEVEGLLTGPSAQKALQHSSRLQAEGIGKGTWLGFGISGYASHFRFRPAVVT